jgi:hypothetical protein
MTRRRFSRLSRFSYADALNLDIRRGTMAARNENGRPGVRSTKPPRIRHGPVLEARRRTPVSFATHGRFTMKNTLPGLGCQPGPRALALPTPFQPFAPTWSTRKGGEL